MGDGSFIICRVPIMVLEQIANLSVINLAYEFDSHTLRYAVCLGGEEAVLKTVGCKRLARSNRVYGV